MKVTILGCGASAGVPVIGCDCSVCTSDNPRNRRSRVSILVEYGDGTKVLVDTSPDLRQQALHNGITDIDAVFYTHEHADHTHGIDDLRPFNVRRDAAIDAYGTADVLGELQRRFDYVWKPHDGGFWARVALTAHEIEAGQAVALTPAATVRTFPQTHGHGQTLGLRFGGVVYSTDVNALPEDSHPFLQDISVWIVDCLRDGFAGSHANLETALQWVERFKPRCAILTHMNHELDYDRLQAGLPDNVRPASDGMVIMVGASGEIAIKESNRTAL